MAKFYKRTKMGGTTMTTKLGTGTPTFSNRITSKGSAVGVTNVYKNGKMYTRTTENVGGYTRVTTKRAGGIKTRGRRGRGRNGSIDPVFLIPMIIIFFVIAAMVN